MLARLISVFERSGLLQLFIVTACIQGGVIISQFLVAPFVDPSVVGVVRSLETVIALVVLAGSLGMQSIAVRDTAACHDEAAQKQVLRQVFVLVGIMSSAVILGVFIAHKFVWTTAISSYVFSACGLVLLTNLLRVTTGFAQGSKTIHEIYLVLMFVTGTGIILHVLLTWLYGVQGWMMARYSTEVLCLLAVWWRLRVYVVPAFNFFKLTRASLYSVAGAGLIINSGLFVRLLVDSLPVLMLTAMRVKTEDIGVFGLAILSLALGQLPLAIVAQRAIPDLVGVLADKVLLKAKFDRFMRFMILVSSGMAGTLIIAAMLWLLLVGGQYQMTAKYVLILAISLPFKAIMLACGTMLVALRIFGLSLKFNIFEGGLVALVLYFGIYELGGWAGVLAYVTGALLSAALLFSAVKIHLRSPEGNAQHEEQ